MTRAEFKAIIKPPDNIPMWVQWMVVTRTVIGFLLGFLFGLLLGYAIWGPLPWR